MKRFIWKCIVISVIFLTIIASTNYFVDPANIFSTKMTEQMVKELSDDKIVSILGDMDERIYQNLRIKSLEETPKIVILGSSHVMMVPWEFDDYYNAGVSGAVLEDYLGIIGILESEDKVPERMIIGVDPWIFNDGCAEHRYESIQRYVEYGKQIIGHENAGSVLIEDTDGLQIGKLKELLSFSYFQSSVFSLAMIVRHHTFSRVLVESNTEYGEREKILPNGRRIPKKDRFLSKEKCETQAKQDIQVDNVYFVSGFQQLSQSKSELFIRMIDYLQDRNVSVEFYLPAWFPAYYEVFEHDRNYSGVMEAEAFIRSIADERGITVHGSYDPAVSGITEEDFMDVLHLKPEIMLQQYQFIK